MVVNYMYCGEVACIKIVLPQFIARGLPNSLQFHIYFHSNEGLNITEVAHDYQSTRCIKQYGEAGTRDGRFLWHMVWYGIYFISVCSILS